MWILNIRIRLRKKKLWNYTKKNFKFNIVLNDKFTNKQKI